MSRRIAVAAASVFILLPTNGCKKDSNRAADGSTSAFLANATPDAREALAIQVDYKLTDENFAKWEIAQRNLDRLPSSAFPAPGGATRGDVVDRAVARLESSPKARTTIEATGLTVRDFVLQTIALAQATEATLSGRPAGAGIVPTENFRFVERHRDRIGRAQLAARNASRRARSAEIATESAEQMEADTTGDGEMGMAESPDTLVVPQPEMVQPRPDSGQSIPDPPPDAPRDTGEIRLLRVPQDLIEVAHTESKIIH